MTGAIRVLVADDQKLVRAGFSALLDAEADIHVVGQALEGADAVRQCTQLRPDVVLMDVRMPQLDGLDATRRITSDPALADVKVVVLTTFELDEYVFGALRAGASGFLLKDVDPQALIDAVRVVYSGQALLAPQATTRLIDAFLSQPVPRAADTTGNLAPREADLALLTPREVQVLTLVGKGLSNHEIAQQLVLSPLTAKTHVSRLFFKLGVSSRAQLVVAAYQTGAVAPTDLESAQN